MLFGQQGAGEGDDRGSGGEDPDDVGPAPCFFVQPFLGVVGPDLPPVRFGGPGEGEYLGAGLGRGDQLRVSIPRPARWSTTLRCCAEVGFWVGLGEDGADPDGPSSPPPPLGPWSTGCAGSGCGTAATTRRGGWLLLRRGGRRGRLSRHCCTPDSPLATRLRQKASQAAPSSPVAMSKPSIHDTAAFAAFDHQRISPHIRVKDRRRGAGYGTLRRSGPAPGPIRTPGTWTAT